jgi:hypothetical protein
MGMEVRGHALDPLFCVGKHIWPERDEEEYKDIDTPPITQQQQNTHTYTQSPRYLLLLLNHYNGRSNQSKLETPPSLILTR